jgi:hypothetical protein
VPWIKLPEKETVTEEILKEQQITIDQARKEYSRKIWQVLEKIEKSL